MLSSLSLSIFSYFFPHVSLRFSIQRCVAHIPRAAAIKQGVIRELSNIGFSVELTSIVSSSSFSSPLDLDLVLLLDAEWVLLLPRQCEFAFPSFVFSRCPHPSFRFSFP